MNTLSKFHSPDYELMYQMLGELKNIFSRNKIKWCSFFGTLLGAVRDNDFAGLVKNGIFQRHDYDIDIIIFEIDKQKFKYAFRDFSKLGYSISLNQLSPAVISKENEWIDLWLFGKYGENKNYVSCGNFPFHKRFFEKLKIGKIKDIEVYVPDFAEEFLELLYGPDWKTPNPNGALQFLDNVELYDKLLKRMKKGI